MQSAHYSYESGFLEGRPLKVCLDQSAFQHNIRVASDLASGSEVVVVIKANAYGHGLIEMARAAGKYDLAVAVPSELVQLRQAGVVENRVWVLEGPFGSECLKSPHNQNVVWVIHSLWQLALFAGDSAAAYNICLKIDTGMHRLGLSFEEFEQALTLIQGCSHINLESCMTHFSASDEVASSSVNDQLIAYDDFLSRLHCTGLKQTLANSGAVLFYPKTHRDYVRPGIMLYGGMPNATADAGRYHLRPVMSFKSAVIAITHVKKGQGVGYGGRWLAPRDSVIATVAGGYGDGYPRHAPNGTPVLVNSVDGSDIAPLVGRVSMDMISIDVTDIPRVQVADTVELWGENIPVDQVAFMSGTIAYELLTSITSRVPRFYCS